MKLKTKAAAYGLAGLALAGTMIFSGSALGLLNVQASGLFSVLLTDPPTVPEGVTAIYVTYTDVSVHAVGFTDSGWVSVSGRGTIDTMKLMNLSETISSGMIPDLAYDRVRLGISGVSVEFMAKNYSASISATEIDVPIVGGLKVTSSSPAAALIDFQPTVVNLGDEPRPSFTMATGAQALQMPSSEVDSSTHEVGHQTSYGGHNWYDTFKSRSTVNLTVSGLSLSPNSLSFSAMNGGTDPLTVSAIVIAPNQRNGNEGVVLGSVANGTAFSVRTDGSLRLLGSTSGQGGMLMGGSGFYMAPGSSHQFSYAGTMTNIFGSLRITAGTSYYVILIGTGTLSVQTVVAS